jgi:hypothetical protein
MESRQEQIDKIKSDPVIKQYLEDKAKAKVLEELAKTSAEPQIQESVEEPIKDSKPTKKSLKTPANDSKKKVTRADISR